ncbi:MAG: hypothetical protein WDO16_21120 [Bacteroidota bacterium]
MRKYSFLFILLVTFLADAPAQKSKAVAPVIPETAGFSSERLKRIDNAMNEWVKNEWMNGEWH